MAKVRSVTDSWVLHATRGRLYAHAPPACLKAVVPIAPYGMASGTWADGAAASLSCPALLIAGDQDRTSGYLRGVRRLFSCGPAPTPRFLLTYRGGTHNDVVPFAPPVAAQEINLPDFLPACATRWTRPIPARRLHSPTTTTRRVAV